MHQDILRLNGTRNGEEFTEACGAFTSKSSAGGSCSETWPGQGPSGPLQSKVESRGSALRPWHRRREPGHLRA